MVDAIICHSDHVEARLQAEFSVPGDKISVIPHGPFFYDIPPSGDGDTLRSFELEADGALVLWQGIIFPYKGIDLLLRSWKQVEGDVGDAYLVIAGTGAPEFLDQIRAQVKDLDLKRVKMHFRFISTEELVALYRAASVVVYPYRAITTSGALATGLALGKAIVASDLPVFRELLTDGENALLVDPQNSAALAGALVEITQNEPLREQFAQKVREMDFGDQSWLSIAKKTIQTYERVLSLTAATKTQ
jgi:glycosyltransferase involved in cell wall biosynthesis